MCYQLYLTKKHTNVPTILKAEDSILITVLWNAKKRERFKGSLSNE